MQLFYSPPIRWVEHTVKRGRKDVLRSLEMRSEMGLLYVVRPHTDGTYGVYFNSRIFQGAKEPNFADIGMQFEGVFHNTLDNIKEYCENTWEHMLMNILKPVMAHDDHAYLYGGFRQNYDENQNMTDTSTLTNRVEIYQHLREENNQPIKL